MDLAMDALCTESNLVAPGADTVTALKAIDGGALCETDVVGMATTYTKFTFTCGSEENPDKVFASLYNCQDATCGSCSDTPELKGYALDNLFNFTSMTTDVGHCVGWSTTSSTNETELAMMASSETAYQNFISPSTLEDSMQYWDVFFRNTCIGSFKGYDAFMAEKTADDFGWYRCDYYSVELGSLFRNASLETYVEVIMIPNSDKLLFDN